MLFLLLERGTISNSQISPSDDRLFFSAECRIKKKKEFEAIYSSGEKLFTKHFLVIAKESQRDKSRIGITVSRKIDKRAVVRNKIKRRIREVFRHIKNNFNKSYDLVVIARRDSTGCSYKEMRRQILGTLRYHRLLKRK